VDRFGIVRDYVGELPTPEDCALGRPNAIGWWSPIENGPMFTGLWLPAVCAQARQSGTEDDRNRARRLAEGLMHCASVSSVPGFIARGVGSDGRCHYPLGSDDQTHPWFLGLSHYLRSGLATEPERARILARVLEVGSVLEASDWRCPCDGAFEGQFRGEYRGPLFRDAVRYLYLLRILAELSGESSWRTQYQTALHERPTGSDLTRIQLCAAGIPRDRNAIRNLDESQLWIYVGCQASLAELIALEQDELIRRDYMAGLIVNAEIALPQVDTCSRFDKDDTKVFGSANWRVVYSEWFPQRTQQDAERLARIVNVAARGERKPYETRWMRNPLAGAAITALALPIASASLPADARERVERALRHYDYGRLHLAESFLADVAAAPLDILPVSQESNQRDR